MRLPPCADPESGFKPSMPRCAKKVKVCCVEDIVCPFLTSRIREIPGPDRVGVLQLICMPAMKARLSRCSECSHPEKTQNKEAFSSHTVP
eukprot:1898432-Rhodomonas_salina.2